jgi:hypothetical protein
MAKNASGFLNVLVVGVASLVTVFFLWYQNYTETANILFWISVIGMTVWDAAYSYKHLSIYKLLLFAIMTMLIGFLTEFIGSQEGLWDFGAHNPPFYIITGWILLAMTMLILTELGYESTVVPAIPPSGFDSYIGAIAPLVLFGFLFGTLGAYRNDTGLVFFAYYIALTILNALYYSRFPDTRKLLLAIVAAWIVGGLSETLGVYSGLWRFTYGFPIWVVVSCWSLEWLSILAVTSFQTQRDVLQN